MIIWMINADEEKTVLILHNAVLEQLDSNIYLSNQQSANIKSLLLH